VAKFAGNQTVWSRATTSAFTTVATIINVKDVSPGAGSVRALFDQSAYGDSWMDFGAGQQEGDEISLTMAYDPADAVHILLKADFDTPAANVWIQALHTPAAKRWKITTVPLTWRLFPDRTGNLELQTSYKIVTPGVVEAAP
jgi:hypothetical protein